MTTVRDTPWIAQPGDAPGDRVGPIARPALDGERRCDLVVVGAGITGLTTALLASRAGMDVVVLEAAHLGNGTTGATTGKVTTQHGLTYARLAARHGEDSARLHAEANRAGVELVVSTCNDLGIDCDLTRADAETWTCDKTRVVDLVDEAETAAKFGLPASVDASAGVPFEVQGTLRFTDQWHLHAGRYLDGLAAGVEAAGGVVHENSRVLSVSEPDDGVRVETADGAVVARHAVLATLLPLGLVGGLLARTRPRGSHGLAVRVSSDGPEVPSAMTITVDEPMVSTRPWPSDGPRGLIVIGGGHEVGSDVDHRALRADLEAWTRRTFDVEDVVHAWSAHDYVSADGLPFIGRAFLSENVYVASGFAKWGLSMGSAGAMLLADLVAGREHQWAGLYSPRRLGTAGSVVKTVADNAVVGAELASGVVRSTPHCTHLGCPLRWNTADATWDCRCHGSRFTSDGKVLVGPAVRPLELDH